MLEQIRKTKQLLEKNIAEFLSEEAKVQSALLRGQQVTYWDDEFSNGQYNQVKKVGSISEVLMDIDVYENYFLSIAFKLTGGSIVLLENVMEVG